MSTPTCSPFDGLANEIIIYILHCCSYKTILQFGFTCKRNYKIVANSLSLRLQMELGVNGLGIVRSSEMGGMNATSSSILEELNHYRNGCMAEAGLDIPVEQPVGHPKVLRWELHSGAYLRPIPRLLPTPQPPPVNLGIKFQKFTADPSQDLAILVAVIPERSKHVQLHMRSLTTGQPHPQARWPDLTVEFDFEASVLADSTVCYVPEVLESVLAVRFDSEIKRMYEVLIWDWKAGGFLHRISSRSGNCASCFIDPSYIAIFSATAPLSEGRLLRDNTYNTQMDMGPKFCVSDYPVLDPDTIFEFPKLRNSHSVNSIALMARSDPVPCRTVYTSSISFAYLRNITLGLSLSLFQHPTTQSDLGGIRNFRGFVSTSLLLNHLDQHRNSRGYPTVLPWDQWGEQATRWFPENEVDLSCSQMSGSRYITVKWGPNNLPGHHHLVITDFNTPIVQRHQDSDHLLTPYSYKFVRQGDNVTLLDTNRSMVDTHPLPSTNAPGSDDKVIIMTLGRDMPGTFDLGFEEVIVSRLPCRVIIRTKPETPHDGWFLDGNCIIGIKNYFDEHPCLSIYNLRISS
ncbi:hypothetical protein B0J17DRAFT_709115 [Rhizoctonia solani]|nr:hypothetical protein B0J17DRAFT_709115 [Rhizoctonia solani]